MKKYPNRNIQHTTADGRVFTFRSMFECRWSRYLDLLLRAGEIEAWDYEPTYFEFIEVRHGTTRYLPDFKVTDKNGDVAWQECKGHLDGKSMTKLRRFSKYYPEERLWLVFDGLPKPTSSSKWANKQRTAIDKIRPFVERVVDASVIFRQLGLKK